MNLIDVANRALEIVGTSTINSLEDDSKEAHRIKANIGQATRTCLALHPWKFAKRQVKLVPAPIPPTLKYARQFALPADFVRIITVDQEDYQVAGRFILCDDDAVELEYVYDQPDVDDWDPVFLELVAQYLAWSVCYSLTSSESQKDAIWKDFEKIQKKARHTDAASESQKEPDHDEWIRVRSSPSIGITQNDT